VDFAETDEHRDLRAVAEIAGTFGRELWPSAPTTTGG
jgi:hypothetical protein